MQYFQGDILTPEGFTKGFVRVTQNQCVVETGNGIPPEKPMVKGIILPTFINAHTHIGDSFLRKKHLQLPRNVQDLVAPPSGLKHRLLKEASEQEILEGIQGSLQEMTSSGTSCFCDFREGGLIGIYQLRKAMKKSSIDSVILSRPSQMTYVKEEIDCLLENSNGIGLSSITDWEPSEIEKISQHARKKKKIFALHASEVVREDIDSVLDLHPSLLVHMNTATKSDLESVKDAKIPIVICPRSYAFFHLKNNFSLMKKTKVTLLLGTDNAMINTPDVGEEVRFLFHTGPFSVEELLTNATYTPRKALNLDDCIQGRTLLKNFIVLERDSLKPIYRYSRNKRDDHDEN